MRTELKSLLRSDFLTFAHKAMRELDGTQASNDAYLDYLATHLQRVADELSDVSHIAHSLHRIAGFDLCEGTERESGAETRDFKTTERQS